MSELDPESQAGADLSDSGAQRHRSLQAAAVEAPEAPVAAEAAGASQHRPSPGSRRAALWAVGLGMLSAAGCTLTDSTGSGAGAGQSGAAGGGSSAGGGAASPGAAASAAPTAGSPRVTGSLTQELAGAAEGDVSDTAPDPFADAQAGRDALTQQSAENAGRPSGGSQAGAGGDGSGSTSEPGSSADGGTSDGAAQEGGAQDGGEAGQDPQSAGSTNGSGPEVYSQAPPSAGVTATTELAPSISLRTSAAWHLARRAATAATADIAAQIESMGAEAWIDAQLAPEGIDDSRAEGYVSSFFSWSQMSTQDLVGPTGGLVYKGAGAVIPAQLTRIRFSNRVLAQAVFEMMGDHVYVPIRNKAESFITGFDQLLRTHCLGRYADLLAAALTSPALLLELDNASSTKDSPNENLGRELLELYTVGRDVYTEDDVAASTVILTGHSMNWEAAEQPYSYVYRPEQHATGAVTVLDFQDPNADAAAGPDLLTRYVEYLAHHEATAKRLATRIARRFIADDPSQAVVEHIAKAYLDNDTRIAPAVRAALTHPDFAASVGRKWRRPLELIMTIARAASVTDYTPRGRVDGGEPGNQGLYGWLIQSAGHEPRMYASVDGYPDTAEYWMSTSLLMNQWNAVQKAVRGDDQESGRTDWSRVLQVAGGAKAKETAGRITWHLTGYAWPDNHLEPVAALLAGTPDSGSAEEWTVAQEGLIDNVEQAVRLCFASPYGFLR